MIRGRKRYILSHPRECPNLAMLRSGPSARHSEANWSDPQSYKARMAQAQAVQVVIEAGDVLYVPHLWFHFIVSVETNIQCNSRSGAPRVHVPFIEQCGFPAQVTEP
jgi:tRNA wybutosine-synthesizing protein 5